MLHPDLKGYWQFFGRVDLGTTWFFHAPVPLGTTKDNFDFRRYLHAAAGAEFDVEFEHIGFWDLRVAIADNIASGGSSSPATPRTAIRPMAATASTPASKTPPISAGSLRRRCKAGPARDLLDS